MIRQSIFFGTVGVTSAFVLDELQQSSEARQLMDTWAASALSSESHPEDTGSTITAVMSNMDVKSAARAVAHKGLPPHVQTMVQTVSRGGSLKGFDENSLKKARLALNELIEKGWYHLDDKIMECKGFEDMNRNNYGQVTRDIARLIQQINDLERVESEAVEGIQAKDAEIKSVEELLASETRQYNQEYAANSAQLTVFQNDMDVFTFILNETRCKEEDMAAAGLTGLYQVCSTEAGRTFQFTDHEKASKYEKLLTPQAMHRLDNLLESVEPFFTNASLLQVAPPKGTVVEPKSPGQKEPVTDGATPFEMNQKCPAPQECAAMCCGKLHDKLSLMWGEHKDKVDELTMIMMKNQYEFLELKTNLNSQIDVLKTAKARLNELLGEARSNLAADNEEMKQKYQQKANLDKQYVEYMKQCRKVCTLWEICSLISVRNAVHEDSTTCPPEKMQDCDVADWVAGECSVSCDDSCDPAKPYACGGWQQMTRGVVVDTNECGYACPRLSIYKRCGQYPCPINCLMSDWSGWSKCTADCGGGVQGRTRSIMMKPKNGGTSCNTVEDQQPCATLSCDRNCRLASWTDFTPCSMACDGGFKERFRHVAIPTRGFGKCPSDNSRYRYQKTSCNEARCNPPMICVAHQDLVIMIDGSGSVDMAGFKILKAFVTKLLANYQTEYWGDTAVKLGVVLFGNGAILPDGKTVTPAILSQQLTFKMDDVKAVVKDLPWQHGFTNMAQGFSQAEHAFIIGARREASSAVMVITDGKPSFNFMTNEMVEQLDDKGIMRYFMLVNREDLNSDANKVMKSWASQPWETNVVHVPGGLEVLEADMDLWVEKTIVKFCPNAYSLADMEWEEINYGYAHVKDGGFCGEMGELLTSDAASAETCAALVSGAGGHSFILGTSWARGRCYKGTMTVDEAQFTAWQQNKIAPECPESEGGWKSSTLYDFYAMQPVSQEQYGS